MPTAREAVPSVGVSQSTIPRFENGVEACDEHVGRKVREEDFVGLFQRLTRSYTSPLGDGTQHALGIGHHQGRCDTFARDVAYDEAHTAVLQVEEIVEVAAHLSCWLVVVGYL